ASLTVHELTSITALSNQTLCLGADANFSTTASGAEPLNYAWSLNGSPRGTNGPSLTVATGNLTLGAHTVAVVVSGPCGSVTNRASLTVDERTSATALSNQTVCLGADANFSTTASGAEPLNYAWSLDGSPTGTNGPSLTVATGDLTLGAHTVSVVVSGPCGSVTNSASLTVNELTSATALSNQKV